MLFSAVIFDVDGVLLDREQWYRKMDQQFFKELGVNINIEEYYGSIGISSVRMWQHIKDKFALSPSVSELITLEKEIKHQILQQSKLSGTEGILELLHYLTEQDYNIGITSSSLQMNIDLILKKLCITPYIDCIVSNGQIEKGKPDTLLQAAALLNTAPEKCVGVADSTDGVAAAKHAGMFCVGFVKAGADKEDLSGADLLIHDFKDKQLYKLFSQ